MLESSPTHPTTDAPEQDYRAVEPLAAVSLIVGLLSALAMLDRPWMLVPVLGIVLSVMGLRRLAADPTKVGRGAVLLGLALSIVFLVAPWAQAIAAEMLLPSQPRRISDQFFEFIQEQSPEKACMLMFAPEHMRFGDGRWVVYRTSDDARSRLLTFASNPLIKTLLALGDNAKIRFYKTEAVGTNGDKAKVIYLYTVTFDDAGKKKTFIIRVRMIREPPMRPDLTPWRIESYDLVGDPTVVG